MKNIFKDFYNSKDDEVLSYIDVEDVSENAIFAATIKKYRVQYLLILILISIFESVMIIRGFLFFDLSVFKCDVYMICYASLLILSLINIIFVLNNFNKDEISLGTVRMLYFYCIFLTVWSCCISLTDVYGGHTPIVFLSVVMGTSALAFLNPIVYSIIVTILSCTLMVFINMYGNIKLLSSGYLVNFLFFIVFTFFISFRKYRQNKIDYLITKKLRSLSYRDQLTGIKNRYALHNDLNNIDNEFYFGIFDFDRFKAINDNYGHNFGDECLMTFAELLNINFKDSAYRYGGDEFIVVTNKNKEEILQICNSINSFLEKKYPGKDVHISGGLYFANKKDSYEVFFKNADTALYEAKETRNGNIVFYN